MDKAYLKEFREFIDDADIVSLKTMFRVLNDKINETTCTKIKTESKNSLDVLPKRQIGNLINEDWTMMYEEKDSELNDYYVYFHVHPKSAPKKYLLNNSVVTIRPPFYVGSGRGNRVYSFERSVMHLNQLKKYTENGFTKKEVMLIFIDGLSEHKAREIESKMILFFGIKNAVDQKSKRKIIRMMSGKSPCLLNNRYEIFPESYKDYAYGGYINSPINIKQQL